jgi:DNA-binding MarR family transcriptional regulator
VTRGVDSLEAAELAVRRPDLNDGRSVLIEPTQRGLELVARLGAVMRAAAAAPKVEPVIEPAVGQRIRACRIPAATYRAELNALVGVSQPQLPRFEVGLTRVAAGLLISITSALGVPVGSGETDQLDLLLRAFSKINQPKRRSALLALADCMADAEVHIAPPACAEIELLLRACIDIPEPKRRSAL